MVSYDTLFFGFITLPLNRVCNPGDSSPGVIGGPVSHLGSGGGELKHQTPGDRRIFLRNLGGCRGQFDYINRRFLAFFWSRILQILNEQFSES